MASRFLLVTASLGTAFLATQLTAWRDLGQAGRLPRAESAQLVLLPVHRTPCRPLIGGLIALFVVVLGKSKRRELVDVVGYYWHFLGVLWIALFAVLKTR